MSRHILRASLNKGEVTPLIHARRELAVYQSAVSELRNWCVLKQGGVRRRSGTRFVGVAKYPDKKVRLMDYVYNTGQSFVLEWGHNYVRFWTMGGQLESSPGVPYEVVTTYTEDEVENIQYAVANDVIYLSHPSHKPAKLQRFGNTNWVLADVDMVDGPWEPLNDIDNAVNPSAAVFLGASVTLTWDNTTGINSNAGFTNADIGRDVRFLNCGYWARARITAVTNTTTVTATVTDNSRVNISSGTVTVSDPTSPALGVEATLTVSVITGINGGVGFRQADVGKKIKNGTPALMYRILTVDSTLAVSVVRERPINDTGDTRSWALGAFGATPGYPGCVAFFENRLCWGRTASRPRAVFASMSNLPERYSPTTVDGTVGDDNGFTRELLSGQADPILWMLDGPRLQLGTASIVRSIGSANSDEITTPRNVSPRIEVRTGAREVTRIGVGPGSLFVGKAGRTFHDLVFDQANAGLNAPDLGVVAEHIFKLGIKRFAFQEVPDSIIWGISDVGALFGITIERVEKVIGFHQHDISADEIRSIATIPTSTNSELWLMAKRTINGSTVTYMEVLDPQFDSDLMEQSDAFFVDCGLTYDGAPTNTVTGLGHLEGKQVDVLADGAPQPRTTVVGAQISLISNRLRSKIQIGLPIENHGLTLPPPDDAPDGSLLGRKTRVVSARLDLIDTAGLSVGSKAGNVSPVRLRTPNDPMSQALALYTGTKNCLIEDKWTNEGQVYWTTATPVPATILAMNINIDAEP